MVRRPGLLLRLLALLTALTLWPGRPPALAQESDPDTVYGPAVSVSVDDILQLPEVYTNKAVRTKGRLDVVPQAGATTYALRGTFGGWLYVTALAQVANEWQEMARSWVGGEVEVSGLVGTGTDPSTGAGRVYISIWSFFGPPEEKPVKPGEVIDTTLENLVTRPGQLDGKAVRVRGQFRGRNLYGDLPSASRRRSADWVIKEELFAVWVTGRKPKGNGWLLDGGLKRDTGKWLEVVGRPRTVRGVVTIEANRVALSTAPSPAAKALPPPAPPPRPQKPPEVVFSLPLDGEREVGPSTIFKVQFSKDMQESSFKGRVVLRYVGPPRPGDRALDAVKIDYDAGLRTLEIDPGDLLRPGRAVEILLLPGIVDLDGLALEPRPGHTPGRTIVDALRFETAANPLGAFP
jgi:hypothetical protein